MREYKFRAWNVRDKIMEYDVDVIQGKPVRQGYQWFNTANTETVYHSPLQQYTGLKDQCGQEIYEDDIIQDDDGFLWQVYFEDGKFRARGGEYKEVEDLNEFCPYWCTVIGNIYENPELKNKSRLGFDYEIEKTPEKRLRAYYEYLLLCKNKHAHAGEYTKADARLDGFLKALELIGIKIEGVNA